MPRKRHRSTSADIRFRNMLESSGLPSMAGKSRLGLKATKPVSESAATLGERDPLDGIGKILQAAASAVSIASGGDYIDFTSTIYSYGFAGVGGDSVIWPISAVGEIQVEFAWDSYANGGLIEIEVDGVVPTWGTIADAASGQYGVKRRSVHIEAGAIVKIKVTQTSGSAQTADVFAEFAIPDPTGSGSSTAAVLLSEEVSTVASPSPGYVFLTNTDRTFEWDGTGTLVLSSTPDGTGEVFVDNVITLDVTHDDASTATYTHDSNPTCGTSEAASVRDVTSYFEVGTNVMDITLANNTCSPAGTHGSTAIYLVRI